MAKVVAAQVAPELGAARLWVVPILAVLLTPLLAHLPELAGWVTCNPIYSHAGLVAEPPRNLLQGMCTIDGNVGGTLQALGGRAAEDWLSGRLPWWNPYSGLGLPLAAEAQPAAFFLPLVLLLHFISGVVLLKLVMQMLTGAFALAAFRELGLSRAAASAGAILFGLNGSFAWFAHSPILPIAFLPALVFGIECCRRRAMAGRAGGEASVALALAYSLLAGFPETAFMDGLLAALWACIALAVTPGARLALVRKIAVGGMVGLALSAPAWISFVDYLATASIGPHGFVGLNHLEPAQALTMVLPGVFGSPYHDFHVKEWTDVGGYFGAAMTLLCVLALYSSRRHALLRGGLAGWIVFWFLAFFGERYAHAIWTASPWLNQVQITRYALPSMEFAGAALLALAVDDWRRAAGGVRIGWAVGGSAALVSILLVIAYRAGRIVLHPDVGTPYLAAALVQAAGIAALLAWLLRRHVTRLAAVALVAIVAADGLADFVLPEFSGAQPNRLELGPIDYLRSHAGSSRVFAIGDQLPINYGAWFGVAGIQADSIPAALRWEQAARDIGGMVDISVSAWPWLSIADQATQFTANQDRLARAGVRFLVVPRATDPFEARQDARLVAAYQDTGTRIYEQKQAAPYFAVIGGPCSLTPASRTLLDVDCAAPGLLLRRELLLPGWRATVNDHLAKVVIADKWFQQIVLPQGKSRVAWRYAPPHANLMAILFALGVAGIGILVIRSRAGKNPVTMSRHHNSLISTTINRDATT